MHPIKARIYTPLQWGARKLCRLREGAIHSKSVDLGRTTATAAFRVPNAALAAEALAALKPLWESSKSLGDPYSAQPNEGFSLPESTLEFVFPVFRVRTDESMLFIYDLHIHGTKPVIRLNLCADDRAILRGILDAMDKK
jgi:hypothetical protein